MLRKVFALLLVTLLSASGTSRLPESPRNIHGMRQKYHDNILRTIAAMKRDSKDAAKLIDLSVAGSALLNELKIFCFGVLYMRTNGDSVCLSLKSLEKKFQKSVGEAAETIAAESAGRISRNRSLLRRMKKESLILQKVNVAYIKYQRTSSVEVVKMQMHIMAVTLGQSLKFVRKSKEIQKSDEELAYHIVDFTSCEQNLISPIVDLEQLNEMMIESTRKLSCKQFGLEVDMRLMKRNYLQLERLLGKISEVYVG